MSRTEFELGKSKAKEDSLVVKSSVVVSSKRKAHGRYCPICNSHYDSKFASFFCCSKGDEPDYKYTDAGKRYRVNDDSDYVELEEVDEGDKKMIEDETDEKVGNYIIRYVCGNCKHEEPWKIEKGTTITEHLDDSECDNCGCLPHRGNYDE